MDYTLLPEHMRDAFRRYIEHGIEGGDFMTSFLCNDLMGSLGKADDVNRHRIFDIACFIYNEAPSQCHGSREKVAAWIARGGINGKQKRVAPESAIYD